MDPTKDTRHFLETVLHAYERRVQIFSIVLKEVNRMLGQLHTEQEVLITDLRERLARSCSLRRKDFDRIMARAGLPWKGAEEQTMPVLEGLEKEGKSLCEVLKRTCENPGPAGLPKLRAISREILSRLEESERQAIRILRKAQVHQEEMRSALKGLVSKGESISIEDLYRTIQGLNMHWGAGKTETGNILEDLQEVRAETHVRWANVLERVQ